MSELMGLIAHFFQIFPSTRDLYQNSITQIEKNISTKEKRISYR